MYNRVVSMENGNRTMYLSGIENSGLAILRRKEAYDK
jgi:hypothetical protein